MVRQIQTGRHSGMPDEMVRGRASWDPSTRLRVVVIKVDAREADARAQLRQGQLSAKQGWLENGIEHIELGPILKAGIVMSGPPGGRPPNAHLPIQEKIEAKIGKDTAHGRCLM